MLPKTRFATLPAQAHEVAAGVTHPKGFVAAGVASGVKKKGKLDLGILLSERPAVSAATFTGNAAAAAPVRLTRETATAPTCGPWWSTPATPTPVTGKQGLADAARMRLLTANHLRLPVEAVAVCSTGIIGVPLPMDEDRGGHRPGGAQAVRRGLASDFATAIRTTDKHAKSGALDARPARGAGAPRLRRQGLRHDQPQHGDHAVLRHLRRGRRASTTGRSCCTAPSRHPSTASRWTGRSRPTTPSSASATAPPA